MGYTGFERLWLFFAFSFFGWVLETAMAAVRRRRLVNRGLVNGPLCVIYGMPGAARNLAVSWQYDLFNAG